MNAEWTSKVEMQCCESCEQKLWMCCGTVDDSTEMVVAYSEKEADVAEMMVAVRPLASRLTARQWRQQWWLSGSGLQFLKHAQGNDHCSDDG